MVRAMKTEAVNPDLHMRVYPVGEAGRKTIEQFIAMRYAADFKARLTSFYPNLLAVKQADGRVVAALGYRSANQHALFLEQYLDCPVEMRMAQVMKRPISRSGILEIGNLASDFSGGNRVLIATLTAYLFGQNARWVVFTGTRALLNSFRRFGIEVHELGVATPDALAESGADWGSYYANQPRVVAVSVQQAYDAILGEVSQPDTGIWAQALRYGRSQWLSGLDWEAGAVPA